MHRRAEKEKRKPKDAQCGADKRHASPRDYEKSLGTRTPSRRPQRDRVERAATQEPLRTNNSKTRPKGDNNTQDPV